MDLYQRKNLETNENIGEPGPVPSHLVGLADEVLADLPSHLDHGALVQLGLGGQGFINVGPPPPTMAELYDYARLVRWQSETGGIVFNGYTLPTDEKGQSYISGAYQAAASNPNMTKRWQVGNQPIQFTTLSNSQIKNFGQALNTLVQQTFDILDQVAQGISNGTITTYAQINTAFGAVNRVFTG